MSDLSITRWCDGTYRPRSIWEPELLELLHQEMEARCISHHELLDLLDDARRGYGMSWLQAERDALHAYEIWQRECAALDAMEVDQ